MELIEVTDKSLEKEFLLMPLSIYKDDPNYIRPLDKDILNVFNPKKNKTFRFGTVKRWLLRDGENQNIGRIAAFTNSKYKNKGDDQKTGGIGFFDCINDQEAADMLFDVSRSWLMQNGMEAMDGPINFGERDRFWGLVVEGFQPPLYLMNYNPPYYQQLFEDYGFKPFFHQLCFSMKVNFEVNEKFFRMNEKFTSMEGYEARHIKKGNMDKLIHDFVEVYNKAWAGHQGNKQIKEETAAKMFKSMKPVIDERIMWFVYHHEKPVACFINLPELNSIFRDYHGKFGLVQKINFLLSRKRKSRSKFVGIVFGVIPEYQGTGIDYFMIYQTDIFLLKHTHYVDYEMQWIGDFNPKMISVAKRLTATVSRKLTTYRYLFDRTKEFKRHPLF